VKTQHKNELKDAQSQMSQENSNKVEIFAVNENKQADQFNEAANQELLSAEGYITSTQSENKTDNIISKTIKSKSNAAKSGEEISNIFIEDSNLQMQTIDQTNVDFEQKKQQHSVKRFIEAVPHFYSLQAQQLYDCPIADPLPLNIKPISSQFCIVPDVIAHLIPQI